VVVVVGWVEDGIAVLLLDCVLLSEESGGGFRPASVRA
jgi:hypothetical protein